MPNPSKNNFDKFCQENDLALWWREILFYAVQSNRLSTEDIVQMRDRAIKEFESEE